MGELHERLPPPCVKPVIVLVDAARDLELGRESTFSFTSTVPSGFSSVICLLRQISDFKRTQI